MDKRILFFTQNPNYFYLKDHLTYSPLISKEVRDESRKYYQENFNLIKEGIEKGVFVNDNGLEVGIWMYSALKAVTQLKLGGEVEISEKKLEQYFEMCWKGIAKEETLINTTLQQ